ncbi:MAG TPA: DNA primase [Thermoanaerobaculaceae bacterium]|nr:DNA primase [Thermoanaerobaculaceae bacterium]HQU33288.1 DNA primase [Thermoanaerobaculaceae bacterium]
MSQYDLSRPVLEQVREAADIVAVVGEHLTLRKTGRNYVGLCPFHGEKTGSFNVSREKGTYYCFGCKRGGDVIDFVMEMERVTFAEAVERLADRFGIRLPPASPEARRRRDEQEQLADVMEAAQAVFARQLSQDRPRAFLERRGVPLDVAAEFGLGYARNEWRALYDELRKKFSERALVGAGLVVEGEGGKVWDRFRDRVTIPIRSARGRIIAYGGRALGDENPKYLNSPETSLFSKGHVLFALDRAMRAFPKANRAVVVEGYFDCIALHRVGLTETVATLGTALSEHHAAELARRVPHVVVCFDGDAAGRQAAVAALRTLLAAALEVSVLVLPDGQDPDDVARREGAEGFGRRVAQAHPAAGFLLELMGPTRQERRRNLLRSLEVVNACPDPVRRFEMRETLARGAGVPLEELGGFESTRMVARHAAAEGLPENAELALLRSFLHDLEPTASAEHLRGFPIDGICHPGVRRVFEVLQRRLASGGGIEIAGVLSEIEEPADRRLLAGLELEAPQTPRERIPSLVDLVRRRADRLRSSEIVVRIRAAELAGDRDALARLQAEQSELIKRPKRGT